jgi:hypothetical protein
MEAREIMNETRSIQNKSFVAAVTKKWAPLLEGIHEPYRRAATAILFENQMQHVRNLSENTTTGNFADFVKFVFPMIRRVWPNLIANNLVSIQPMTGPIGGIFTWEYKYGTSKGTITAGDNMIENFDRYYSSEYIYHEVIATGNGATANYTGNLSWTPVKPFISCPQAQVGLEFTTLVGTAAKRIYDPDGSGDLAGDTGAASTITYSDGAYDITWDGNVDDKAPIYANYFFDMEGANVTVPQVYLDIGLDPIKVSSRKLKFLWSAEAADDLKAIHGMDAEGELVGGVASELALEIDRELIMDMYLGAAAGTNKESFDADVSGLSYSPVEHYMTLLTKIAKVSQEVGKQTLRGPGNWIVTSTRAASLFSAMETHGSFKSVFDGGSMPAGQGTLGQPAPQPPTSPSGFGVYGLGVLQNRWTVYVDPLFPDDQIMIGLKGPTFLDSGMVYAPYVPLQVTPTFLDPDDQNFRKGMRTRYAKKLVNNKYYGLITCSNLP